MEFIHGNLAKKRGNHRWKFDSLGSGFERDERRNPDSRQTGAGQDRFVVYKPLIFKLVLEIDKLHGIIVLISSTTVR
jgi:hypothetical protein